MPEALEYVNKINPDIIHISAGGLGFILKEEIQINHLLKKNIKIVAAAGNEQMNLDLNCNYYPACYDKRIYVIGNYGNYSNYGNVVDKYINGKDQTGFGVTLSGTSQSAAKFTNELLRDQK